MRSVLLDNNEPDRLLDLAARITTLTVMGRNGQPIQPAILRMTGFNGDLIRGLLDKFAPDKVPLPDCSEEEFLFDYTQPWVIAAYKALYNSDPDNDQLFRFWNMINVIPDWDAYAAYYNEFTHKWPAEPTRPGRPDDKGHPTGEELKPNVIALYHDAVEFLLQPARTGYVKNGITTLGEIFSQRATKYLQEEAQVYIIDDLERFTEKDLII